MIRGSLHVVPWVDELVDRLGHDPRSAYAERFWLAVIGPTTSWVLRRLVRGLDDQPDGFRVAVSELARSVGLGTRDGASAGLERALQRASWFDLVRFENTRTLAVRRHLPPLTRVQVLRLPPTLRIEHQRWLESRPTGVEVLRRRCRQLALSLVELGEDFDGTERQLLRWRYHPALAHESAVWAWDRHRQAQQAVAAGSPTP